MNRYEDDRPPHRGPRRPWTRQGRGRPVYGFPVRGYRTYDLDYGGMSGPTEYSGRAGYAARDAYVGYPPRPDRPSLAEIGRDSRLRRWAEQDGYAHEYARRRGRARAHRRSRPRNRWREW